MKNLVVGMVMGAILMGFGYMVGNNGGTCGATVQADDEIKLLKMKVQELAIKNSMKTQSATKKGSSEPIITGEFIEAAKGSSVKRKIPK